VAGSITGSQTAGAVAGAVGQQAPAIAAGMAVEAVAKKVGTGRNLVAVTKGAENVVKLGRLGQGIVNLVGVLLMAALGAAIGKDCGGVMEGTGITCALIDVDCSKIKTCADYTNVNVKGDRENSSLGELGGGTRHGERSDIQLESLCKDNPCQLPFTCTYVGGVGGLITSWDPESGSIGDASRPSTSTGACGIGGIDNVATAYGGATRCCSRDVIGPQFSFNTAKKQKKGFFCEKDEDCESGLSCSGGPSMTMRNVLVRCQGYQNPDPDCTSGWIAPNTSIVGTPCHEICNNDAMYNRYAQFFKRTDKTLKRCQ
jgi:hypothetical protein